MEQGPTEQHNRAVSSAISIIIMYLLLILNVYVIITKDSIVSKALAILSSVIFIALLVFLYKAKQHPENK